MGRNNRTLSRIWLGGDTQCYYENYPDAAKAVLGLLCISFPGSAAPGFLEYMRNEVTPWNSHNPWLRKYWETLYECSWEVSNNSSNCSDYKTAADLVKSATFYSGKVWDGIHAYAIAIHDVISQWCPHVFEQKDEDTLDYCVTGARTLKSLKSLSMEGIEQKIEFGDDGELLPQYLIKHYIYHQTENKYEDIQVAEWYRGQDGDGVLTIDLSLLQWNHLDFGEDTIIFEDRNTSVVVPVSVCSQECGPKQYKIRLEQKCCWNCHDCQVNGILVENSTSCEICPEYTWPDMDTITRCEAIPVTYLNFSDPIGLALVIMAAVGAAICIGTICLFAYKRNSKLVKATNRQLTMLILFGGTLACTLLFFFMMKPSVFSCGVRQVGFHLTVSLLYCPIFVKTSRIYRIFSAGKNGITRPGFISSGWQTILTTLAIGIQVC